MYDVVLAWKRDRQQTKRRVLFCWDFLSFNVAAVTKLGLDFFLTDFEVTIFNVESRERRLDWNFCFHTVVFFTAQSDLVVLIITDEMKENKDSLKVVVVVVVVVDVRFLSPFDLFQSLSIIMMKNEAKTERKFNDSETVVSLFSVSLFFFCLLLCLAVSLFFFCLSLCLASRCLAFRSAAFAAVKA